MNSDNSRSKTRSEHQHSASAAECSILLAMVFFLCLAATGSLPDQIQTMYDVPSRPAAVVTERLTSDTTVPIEL